MYVSPLQDDFHLFFYQRFAGCFFFFFFYLSSLVGIVVMFLIVVFDKTYDFLSLVWGRRRVVIQLK